MRSTIIIVTLLLSSSIGSQAQTEFPVYQALPIIRQPIIIKQPSPSVRIQNNTYINAAPQSSTTNTESNSQDQMISFKLDEKHGYRNLKLGEDLLSIMNVNTLTPIDKASFPTLKAYKLWNIANYPLGDQEIKSLTLEFLGRNLVSILVELPEYDYTTDMSNRNAIIDNITLTYGNWQLGKITPSEVANNVGQVLIIAGETTMLMAHRHKAKKDTTNHIACGDTFRFFSLEYTKLLLDSYDSGL